jgi:hypothetical protein
MGSIYFLRHTASVLSLVFASFNIASFNSAQLVEFNLKNQTEGSLVCISRGFKVLKSFIGIDLMIMWVVDYFTPKETIDKPTNIFETLTNSPVRITDKMPLILQHDGHSRTIVGYEIDGRGITNLLMFDPA